MSFKDLNTAREEWIIPQKWVISTPGFWGNEVYTWEKDGVISTLAWCWDFPRMTITIEKIWDEFIWKCMNLLEGWKCSASWDGTQDISDLKDCPLAKQIEMIIDTK